MVQLTPGMIPGTLVRLVLDLVLYEINMLPVLMLSGSIALYEHRRRDGAHSYRQRAHLSLCRLAKHELLRTLLLLRGTRTSYLVAW